MIVLVTGHGDATDRLTTLHAHYPITGIISANFSALNWAFDHSIADYSLLIPQLLPLPEIQYIVKTDNSVTVW